MLEGLPNIILDIGGTLNNLIQFDVKLYNPFKMLTISMQKNQSSFLCLTDRAKFGQALSIATFLEFKIHGGNKMCL